MTLIVVLICNSLSINDGVFFHHHWLRVHLFQLRSNHSLLWFGYEVFFRKTHVLKAWSPAGGAIMRWLDNEVAYLVISEFIAKWTHEGGFTLEEVAQWGQDFEGYILSLTPSSFLWDETLCSTILTAMMFFFTTGPQRWV
jgi:hypothetical protein